MKDGGGQTAPFLKCQLSDIDENFGDALSTSHNNGFKIWTISAPMFFRKSVVSDHRIRMFSYYFPLGSAQNEAYRKDYFSENLGKVF